MVEIALFLIVGSSLWLLNGKMGPPRRGAELADARPRGRALALKEDMNEPKKPEAVPVEAGPVVSQAGPGSADVLRTEVPTPEVPLSLSQVPATGWTQGNLPQRS